ncbi:hypothetical protein TNCV_4893791 [Trichonephila clavipes]|nr:hypothetical protein TNCV_4893791 [Trichonephila clavipes]
MSCTWSSTADQWGRATTTTTLSRKESKPNNFILAARWRTASLASLSTRLVKYHCTQPMDWPQRASRQSLHRMASTFTRSDAMGFLAVGVH